MSPASLQWGPAVISPEPSGRADVSANLALVRHRISAAGVDPATVTVVAVTKGFGPAEVMAAHAVGLVDFGENYAQELLAKAAQVCQVGGAVRWHFLGPVQRNKVTGLAHSVDVWQTVDRLAVGEAIVRRRADAPVLVQVNVSGEATKHGCRPDEATELVGQLRQLRANVVGLMTVGPRLGVAAGPSAKPGAAAEPARSAFRLLARMASQLGLQELSMGMTDDLEMAVQEGATMVRIGRGLFGPRPRIAPPATIRSLNGGD